MKAVIVMVKRAKGGEVCVPRQLFPSSSIVSPPTSLFPDISLWKDHVSDSRAPEGSSGMQVFDSNPENPAGMQLHAMLISMPAGPPVPDFYRTQPYRCTFVNIRGHMRA